MLIGKFHIIGLVQKIKLIQFYSRIQFNLLFFVASNKILISVGAKVYDLIAYPRGIGNSYFLSKQKALEAFPVLRTDNLKGTYFFYLILLLFILVIFSFAFLFCFSNWLFKGYIFFFDSLLLLFIRVIFSYFAFFFLIVFFSTFFSYSSFRSNCLLWWTN